MCNIREEPSVIMEIPSKVELQEADDSAINKDGQWKLGYDLGK